MSDACPTSLTHPNQVLAWETIHRRPARGIPSRGCNVMEWAMIDRLAGAAPGSYERDPVPTYRSMQEALGTCLEDQWIPRNPLTMESGGYGAGKEKGATTGLETVVVDGREIREPEDVVAHLEEVAFPRLRQQAADFDEDAVAAEIVEKGRGIIEEIGPTMLLAGHTSSYGARLPGLGYNRYGYGPYFMAYALYPEVMERDFALQADLAERRNRATVRAVEQEGWPRALRLDHDMADSRGTLVDVASLDRRWFPHFDRAIRPLVDAGFTVIWHCDGNLMEMVPRLLACGLKGFQGFQYEDGMDYAAICKMKSRDHESLLIHAGVSVTTTLPRGTPDDVKRELRWLVDEGPPVGLVLGASSSVAPGVPWENLVAFKEGLAHYREHGRDG